VAVVGLGLMVLSTRSAFRIPALLDPAPDPRRPVLFYNPKSGGGKAEKFHLADEARARGIEPIELKPGTDLEQLVRGAVADGADALAMAGGDGSQAVVAMVAAGQDSALCLYSGRDPQPRQAHPRPDGPGPFPSAAPIVEFPRRSGRRRPRPFGDLVPKCGG
jgi:hypothetical protein